MEQELKFIRPEQLAAITDLQLLARTVVDGLMAGLHRSPHSGSSIEFAQYRAYAQGDDLRKVDWRLFGRTDRLHVKQYEEETTLRATILLDCSGSMDYGSHALVKFDYARMLAASLAVLLRRQRDAAGLIAYHHDLLQYIPPMSSDAHVRRILVELDNVRAEGHTDTPKALHYLGDVLKPRGVVILISDLLHPIEEMILHLKSLRARQQDVIVMQISDPAEQTFPFDETVTFVDAESGHEQYTVPDAVRQQYLENREKHFEALRRACLEAEIELTEFTTDEPLDRALRFYLNYRNHSATQAATTRRNSAGGVA
ncbi:MAG: DUF58 domain-containing protein [Candidatus Hydrogenedentota bacterium]